MVVKGRVGWIEVSVDSLVCVPGCVTARDSGARTGRNVGIVPFSGWPCAIPHKSPKNLEGALLTPWMRPLSPEGVWGPLVFFLT